MGNKFIAILLFNIFLFNTVVFAVGENNFSDIDMLINKVKMKRQGLNTLQIKKLKNPFISEKKLQKAITNSQGKIKKRVSLQLSMIINNRVKIGKRWYKIFDRIGVYTISKIDPYRGIVVLTYRKKKKTLYLDKKTPKKNLILISH